MHRLHPNLLAIGLCAVSLGFSGSMSAQSAPSEASMQPAGEQADGSINSSRELPDSPGTVWAKSPAPAQQSPPPQGSGAVEQTAQTQDQKLQRPVGTAAAEAPKVSGITAAQPAGAAIAPAKQKRVRTLVLKVGAILGASAAIGTVVALSAATPSKPPGAH